MMIWPRGGEYYNNNKKKVKISTIYKMGKEIIKFSDI